MKTRRNCISKRRAALAAIAAAAMATVTQAEQTGDMVTISISGATFMRSFTSSTGFTLLNPGTEITLNSGAGGAPVVYKAATGITTSVQLGAPDLTGTITPNPASNAAAVTTANYAAVRVEWHEQGSIEGVLELINDQIGRVDSVNLLNRSGSSGNPTWVNSNAFGRNGTNVVPPTASFGGTGVAGVTTVTVKGFSLKSADYNTYTSYDDSSAVRPGRHTQGGQNRVQWAISDVNASQGFSIAPSGTSQAAWYRQPGEAGYGKGNQNLSLAAPGNLQGVGTANVRHEFADGSIANMDPNDTSNGRNGKDPTTNTAYAVGTWNTAGVNNLTNVTVANGGLAFAANPGTGLTRLNRKDAVFLQSTGRLANGADFNVTTRDAYSGTLNTASANVGLDPTFAVGENDDGNGNGANALAETRVGSLKFSGKTSGGQGILPTVQNSRMAIGHLSSSDSVPVSKNSVSRPVRTLDYRDDDDDLANGSNNLLPAQRRNHAAYADPITGDDTNLDIFGGFTRLSAKSLVEGSYTLRTNQTYIFAKRPNAAEYGLDLLKGDNSGNDVRDIRDNIMTSVSSFSGTNSIANPADQMLAKGFLIPKLVKYTKDRDGLNRDVLNPDYDSGLASLFLSSPAYTAPFNPDDPATIKAGTGLYGNNNIGGSSATPVGGSITVNNNNYLFGDFDQSGGEFDAGSNPTGKKGIRDFSDLTIATQAAKALHNSTLGTDWNANAGSNAGTNIAALPAQLAFNASKGDLIVLGDFNSDGKFNGADLRLMARGTALADSTSSTTLTPATADNFGDMVRNGVLRKNQALTQMQADTADAAFSGTTATNASAALRAAASAIQNTADPNYLTAVANAFNKLDVNRDGLVNRLDAKVVDQFANNNITSLDHQLAAVVNGAPISLVDVELDDNLLITRGDFDLVKAAVTGIGSGKLTDGDWNFDGLVDLADFDIWFGNVGDTARRWSHGDTNGDGFVDLIDFDSWFSNVGLGVPGAPVEAWQESALAQIAAVPEPGTFSVLALGAVTLLGRRRRHNA